MDTNISITNSRENELQFDLSVKGTDVSEMQARFVIELDNIKYMFQCKQSDTAARWLVNIPKMSYLPHGTYDFYIEIITNGYYFNPYNGKVTVAAEPVVSQSEVTKSVPVPIIKDVTTSSSETSSAVKENDVSLDDSLVSAFLQNKEELTEQTIEKTKKDKATIAALKSINKTKKTTVTHVNDTIPPPRKIQLVKPISTKEINKEPKELKQSILDKVIKNIGVPMDEQARKVHDIINSFNKDNE